jgi:hypothetical protein
MGTCYSLCGTLLLTLHCKHLRMSLVYIPFKFGCQMLQNLGHLGAMCMLLLTATYHEGLDPFVTRMHKMFLVQSYVDLALQYMIHTLCEHMYAVHIVCDIITYISLKM